MDIDHIDSDNQPTFDLAHITESHRHLHRRLDEREQLIAGNEAKARAVLSDCQAQREEISRQRNAIDIVDRLSRVELIPIQDDELRTYPNLLMACAADHATIKRRRARVGPQRYRMLAYLRGYTGPLGLSAEDISGATRLDIKRVRAQLRSDDADGYLRETGGLYSLLPAGMFLLTRFEDYKRNRGEPLPPLEGPVDDEADEGLSDSVLEERAMKEGELP